MIRDGNDTGKLREKYAAKLFTMRVIFKASKITATEQARKISATGGR
jgi:hypothetical protein